MYLRCVVQAQPHKWKAWLSLAEFWYNTSYHTSLDCSPFKILYGYEPPFAAAPTISSEVDTDVATWMADRATMLNVLRDKLADAQNRMKQYADRSRSERQFQVGEMVLLKLQSYAQHSVVNRPCPQLAFKFFGPYKVIERIGEVAYRLELPKTAQVHPVFHVSQLKPFTPNYVPVFSELPKVNDLNKQGVVPFEVLDRRLVKKGNPAVTQVLVRWSNIPPESATWEDFEVVRHRFPESVAWGQATSEGGADVTAEE